MIVFIDNHDSFTWNLVDYLHILKQEVHVVTNLEVPSQKLVQQAKGIMLSPGPGTPQQSGYLMQWLEMAINLQKPILGICLGMQAIGVYYGAQLAPYDNPVHGRASAITHTGENLFLGMPQPMEVGRYHSLALSAIVKPLEVIAENSQNIPMAVRHENGIIYGVQFHPESVLSPQGLALLENWVNEIS